MKKALNLAAPALLAMLLASPAFAVDRIVPGTFATITDAIGAA